MTTPNPENYRGATTTLVGYLSQDAGPQKFGGKVNDAVTELRIPITEGYKKDGNFVETGTTWYSYTAAGDVGANLRSLKKGDKVRIENAKQEVREYDAKDGSKRLAITLRYGTVTVLESKNSAPASDTWVDEAGDF